MATFSGVGWGAALPQGRADIMKRLACTPEVIAHDLVILQDDEMIHAGDELKALRAENRALRDESEALRARVDDIEARFLALELHPAIVGSIVAERCERRARGVPEDSLPPV